MILKQIELVNFRRYQNLKIAFNDGITGIVGKNGAGKSTILEAILWCLYGSRAARTGKDGIKRQSASTSDTCSVTLDFELKGKLYSLNRSIIGKSNRSETKLTQQGRLDAVTTREVDDYIIRLIGLNLKGFLSSFFARQRELNALSDARPAERRNHLAKMLGVGRLDSAIESLKQELKGTRQNIEIISARQIDIDEINSEISKKEAETKELTTNLAQSAEKQKDLLSEVSRLEREFAAIQEQREEFIRLDKQEAELAVKKSNAVQDKNRLDKELGDIDAAVASLPELSTKISDIKDLEEIRQGLIKARTQLTEKSEIEKDIVVVKKLSDKILSKENQLVDSLKVISKQMSGFSDLKSSLSLKNQTREQLLQEYTDTKLDLAALNENLKKLKKQRESINLLGPDASCEFCLRSFGKDFASIEQHFAQELLSLEEQIKPLSKSKTEIYTIGQKLKNDIAEIEAKNEQANILERRKSALEAELESLKRTKTETEGRLKILNQRLAEYQEVEYSSDKLADIEAKLTEKKRAQEEYIRISDRVSKRDKTAELLKNQVKAVEKLNSQYHQVVEDRKNIGFDPEKFTETQTSIKTKQEEISSGEVLAERFRGGIKLLEKDTEQLNKQIEEFEKSQKEVADLRRNLQYQEKLGLLLAEFRVFLIGRIRPALSRQTSQLFHEMTGGRYQEVELDEDYNLCLYDNGEKFSIDRFSGGEIDLANLCFRLAISIEMASTAGIENSFIILDEIFGSQDNERQHAIVEGLSRLRNRFQQIIIVSHIDEVKELSENIIEIEIDNSGTSTVALADNR
ncbi:MAG: SMC family ATPase [candidate division Zixibacteria bacterium]|nr:SMC family ATPase [candidate division Zixibacteria bacterium]